MWSKRCLSCVSRFCCRVLWSWLTIFWLLSPLFFFHWVVSFAANTVNSNLKNRWKKNVKKSFFVIWIWIFGFKVHGTNVLITEPTVIWDLLLLCELLQLVCFVAMNNFFLIFALSIDFFGWVASLLANIVNCSLRHRTKCFQGKFHRNLNSDLWIQRQSC